MTCFINTTRECLIKTHNKTNKTKNKHNNKKHISQTYSLWFDDKTNVLAIRIPSTIAVWLYMYHNTQENGSSLTSTSKQGARAHTHKHTHTTHSLTSVHTWHDTSVRQSSETGSLGRRVGNQTAVRTDCGALRNALIPVQHRARLDKRVT